VIVLAALFCVARVALEEELAPFLRRLEERRAAHAARAALPIRLVQTGTVRRIA
jgi:hypothetical protein